MLDLMTLYTTQRKQCVCWYDQRNHRVGTEQEQGSEMRNLLLLLLLLLKKVGSGRLRETDVHPVSSKTPAPQYQPIDRKMRKGKRVEDYSSDRAA